MSDQQQLYDVAGAAGYMRQIGAGGTTTHFIRSLIASGQLPFLKIGKKFFVTKAAIDVWIERRQRKS